MVPHLGTLNNRCRIKLRTPKRDPNFENHPHVSPTVPAEAPADSTEVQLAQTSTGVSGGRFWVQGIYGLGFSMCWHF